MTALRHLTTNGATRLAYADEAHEASGGGAWCEDTSTVVSNCVLSANTADYTYGVGGGTFSGTLYNCTFIGNSAAAGGGAYSCTLNNCTFSNNNALATIGGGAWASTLNNCVLTGNSAPRGGGTGGSTLNDCVLTNNAATADYGGGVDGCTLSNCILSGNSAISGGGAALGTLNNCIIISNVAASFGGGTYSCNLSECTLSSNSASNLGGGAYSSTLTNCTLTGNSAVFGGGADQGTLNNCILFDNIAFDTGGGVNAATIKNSALIGNTAINNGGGAAGSTLSSCTLTDNSAFSGGGIYSSSSTNCIVYYNNALVGTNYDATSSLGYCCTIPLPANGSGNITEEPELADGFHLSADSPCLGAGNSTDIAGVDIDGDPWANPPATGCDEYNTGGPTGQLEVAIQATFTNLAKGFAGNFAAQISGHTDMCLWDFGDGIQATNQPYVSHIWTTVGNYQVSLRAFNESNPTGVQATITVQVTNQPIQYVALGNTNPVAPYLTWATAATNIQDAVDTAFGGGVILVSNGVYQTGGRVVIGILTNRVAITRPTTLESVNGPTATIIEGYQIPGSVNGDGAVRCVYLANGANLIGFTLANGATRRTSNLYSQIELDGGGIWCQSTNVTVSNCTIVSNSCLAYGAGVYAGSLTDCQINNNTNQNSGSYGGGGGVAYGVLLNSTINSNFVGSAGGNASGGAFACILSNCVVAGNSMGGVFNCTLNVCTIANNTNSVNGGGASQSILNNCGILNNQTGQSGGGAYDCTLSNCTVLNNWAGIWGGGAYDDTYETIALGQNNYFAGNSAGYFGGGLYITAGASGLTRNIDGWTFSSNSAARDGGGLYLTSARSTLNNCVFWGNSSGGNGGGFSGVSPNLTAVSNCTFSNNIAVGGGGGAYLGILAGCSVIGNKAGNGGGVYGTINNCVVNGNIATSNGGGLYYYAGPRTPPAGVNCNFTNNFALNGGGANGGTFTNCIFEANSATNSGGGVYQGTLAYCIVHNNSSGLNGGGVYNSQILNCLLTGNSAAYGGGACQGSINNATIVSNIATSAGGGTYSLSGATSCVIYDNTAPTGPNFSGAGSYNYYYCCTIPLPAVGNSNITNDPVFVNFAAGNFRLQTNSPCIDAGSGSPGSIDLDGRPRIVGGRIDVGAYEFQGPSVGEFIGWLQQYGLPTDGSADYVDLDGTGFNVYQDWIAGLNPTNALSVLAMLAPTPTNNPTGLVVSWESVSNITYFLQSGTNLGAHPAFSTIQSNIIGQTGTTTYDDTNAIGNGPFFYRVGVQQ
jgi:hypothetical protein